MQKSTIMLTIDKKLKEVIKQDCVNNDVSVSWLFSKLFQSYLEGNLKITIASNVESE